jgi:hypothetical protein
MAPEVKFLRFFASFVIQPLAQQPLASADTRSRPDLYSPTSNGA